MDFEFGKLFFLLGIWGGGFLPRACHFGCDFADVGRGGLMAPTSVFLVKKLPPNVRNMHQNRARARRPAGAILVHIA